MFRMKSINREILKLAIPSILANITVPIVGMADIAVAGHLRGIGTLTVATLISGIAIGSMLFDLLYWNFAFLRIGTGGLTAQAYGRGDTKGCTDILCRSTGLALLLSIVLIAIQWIFVKIAFLVVDCTPEVQQLAEQYFFIRIWAAPATLSLMALKGWFIGMQDSISSMAADLVVNIANVAFSIVLALGFHAGDFHYDGIGFSGIAAGTVIAQYMGFVTCLGIVFFKYRRKIFDGYGLKDLAAVFNGHETRKFFTMNTDLFIRSLCFMGIYIGFTTFSAHYGDLILATSSIMMKILLLFSYFTDGFAYAGEAMTGKYIGMMNHGKVVETIRYTFIWSMGIALIFMVIYGTAGIPVIKLMTSDPAVIEACRQYIPWLLCMPLIGCAAFTWDGIYVGATAARSIRNAMIYAAAGFLLTYFIGVLATGNCRHAETDSSNLGLHLLLLAYFIHLIIRAIYLTIKYRRVVLDDPFDK
ncbi:MAG: MATE family efflux transporter [Clostridium sp.]|nr:MATE family efflux transporter [Bacteroides sp.]MCM1197490.1 MATE family efflux transporter [Clostridium sp.]